MTKQAWFSGLLGLLRGHDPAPVKPQRPKSDYVDYNQPVVGESQYQEALFSIAGGYSRDSQRIPCSAALVREPSNPHDTNAIRVEIDGKLVGYLPARLASRFSVSAKAPLDLPKTAPAVITGGWRTNQHDAGHFGVRLAL